MSGLGSGKAVHILHSKWSRGHRTTGLMQRQEAGLERTPPGGPECRASDLELHPKGSRIKVRQRKLRSWEESYQMRLRRKLGGESQRDRRGPSNREVILFCLVLETHPASLHSSILHPPQYMGSQRVGHFPLPDLITQSVKHQTFNLRVQSSCPCSGTLIWGASQVGLPGFKFQHHLRPSCVTYQHPTCVPLAGGSVSLCLQFPTL